MYVVQRRSASMREELPTAIGFLPHPSKGAFGELAGVPMLCNHALCLPPPSPKSVGAAFSLQDGLAFHLEVLDGFGF